MVLTQGAEGDRTALKHPGRSACSQLEGGQRIAEGKQNPRDSFITVEDGGRGASSFVFPRRSVILRKTSEDPALRGEGLAGMTVAIGSVSTVQSRCQLHPTKRNNAKIIDELSVAVSPH
ncbi:hypothetical protein AAFF_G00183140 [Aldrovandia affinis]|uniref:Uncharacterized protein n=1 Tax=Aldrovandia affinis TaxID=143900 RepID=A0AAD7RK58_9TELE|nr:hypothetical protein AAFF_G00183140 [Aldrovandia affinis]